MHHMMKKKKKLVSIKRNYKVLAIFFCYKYEKLVCISINASQTLQTLRSLRYIGSVMS